MVDLPKPQNPTPKPQTTEVWFSEYLPEAKRDVPSNLAVFVTVKVECSVVSAAQVSIQHAQAQRLLR